MLSLMYCFKYIFKNIFSKYRQKYRQIATVKSQSLPSQPTPQHLNLPCLLMHGMINPSDNNLMIYTKIELQNLATKFQKAGRESPSSIL